MTGFCLDGCLSWPWSLFSAYRSKRHDCYFPSFRLIFPSFSIISLHSPFCRLPTRPQSPRPARTMNGPQRSTGSLATSPFPRFSRLGHDLNRPGRACIFLIGPPDRISSARSIEHPARRSSSSSLCDLDSPHSLDLAPPSASLVSSLFLCACPPVQPMQGFPLPFLVRFSAPAPRAPAPDTARGPERATCRESVFLVAFWHREGRLISDRRRRIRSSAAPTPALLHQNASSGPSCCRPSFCQFIFSVSPRSGRDMAGNAQSHSWWCAGSEQRPLEAIRIPTTPPFQKAQHHATSGLGFILLHQSFR